LPKRAVNNSIFIQHYARLATDGGPPSSFKPANTALRCHSNKADRSSRAAADGAVGRHL
jgi:hypothetical protein